MVNYFESKIGCQVKLIKDKVMKFSTGGVLLSFEYKIEPSDIKKDGACLTDTK